MRFKEFFLLREQSEELEPIVLHGEYWFDENGNTVCMLTGMLATWVMKIM